MLLAVNSPTDISADCAPLGQIHVCDALFQAAAMEMEDARPERRQNGKCPILIEGSSGSKVRVASRPRVLSERSVVCVRYVPLSSLVLPSFGAFECV